MKDYLILDISLKNIKIQVSLQGFGESDHKQSYPIHSHASFEYHMVFEGNALFESEKQIVLLEKNDAILVFPETFHRLSGQDEEPAILSFSFALTRDEKSAETDLYAQVCERLYDQGDFLILPQSTQAAEYLRRIMANVYSRAPFATEETRALFVLLFSQLLSLFIQAPSPNAPSENAEYDTRVYLIEEYFNEYYMYDISLCELAKRLHLSERQTDRMIQKYFGNGFRAHLRKVRLKSAQSLLQDSDAEIKQIAEDVGYRSYNGFYAAFTSAFGITPLAYRTEQRKTNIR